MLYSCVVHKNARRSTLLLTDLYGHSHSRKIYLINILFGNFTSEHYLSSNANSQRTCGCMMMKDG